MKGQDAEAVHEHQKEISLDGETTSTLCYQGDAYASSGKRDEALIILSKLKPTKVYVSSLELTVLCVRMGEKKSRS